MTRTIENMKLVHEALEALLEWDVESSDLVRIGQLVILIEDVKLDIAELERGRDTIPV